MICEPRVFSPSQRAQWPGGEEQGQAMRAEKETCRRPMRSAADEELTLAGVRTG
jgi:hypothetical protein